MVKSIVARFARSPHRYSPLNINSSKLVFHPAAILLSLGLKL